MKRRRAVLDRLRAAWESSRQRHWDLEGGPGPALRWSMRHPWVVTVSLAVALTVVLGSTFGIPPVSPLALVVLVVAPIPLWLRHERRLHAQWQERNGS